MAERTISVHPSGSGRHVARIAVDTDEFASAIGSEGWAVTAPLVDASAVAALRDEVIALSTDGRGGVRNLLESSMVRALALTPTIRALATAVLGPRCFAVRAILFDKTPTANWKVIWHQDLTIAVRARAEIPGFGPWTEKDGVPHVQPPVEILEQMLAIRVHLDPCGTDNGPVRVLASSHTRGKLTPAAIDEFRRANEETECQVAEGGILAFRPLLLHASASARTVAHRRVVHIEFAAAELPPPLEWHRRVE